MKKLLTLVSASALLAAAGAAVHADEPGVTSFVVFGDSLSDDGNISDTLGISVAFPPAPYSQGRFSNGDVFTQILAGLTNADSYLNFAHGGAFTGQLPAPSPLDAALGRPTFGNIGLASSLGDYIAAGATPAGIDALANTDVRSQINGYLASGANIGEDDLFSVYASANNYFFTANGIATAIGLGAINPTTPAGQAAIAAQVEGAITVALGDIAAGVTALANNGAKQILLPNLPNLGATPLGAGPNAALFSSFSDNHNANLASAAAQLADAYDIAIYVVDVETLISDIQANPGKYGFTNTTDACISVLACVTADTATQNGYIFFDDVHPTTAVHSIAAAYAADTFFAPRTIPSQGVSVAHGMSDFNQVMIQADRAAGVASTPGDSYVFADVHYHDRENGGEMKAYGFESTGTAINLGYVRHYSDILKVGLVGGLAQSDADLSMGVGSFEEQSWRLGGFTTLTDGPFSVLLGLSYASVSLDDIERNTNVAGQVTSGSSDGYAAGGLFEARYKVSQSDALNIALLGRAHGSYIELDGYTETGATGLNQIVEDRTLAPFYAELGGELTGNSGFNWRLEGVYVDAIEGPDQEVTTALVTVANVARTINTEADESGYGRFTGSALLDLGMVGLEVGGQVTAGRDDGDGYGAFVRAARTF